MVAYSFRKRFIEPILAGTKSQTIRSPRKRHAYPGETLQLYHGMRTKQCVLITKAKCRYVQDITISLDGLIRVGGARAFQDPSELDYFAISDGFVSWDDMKAFWREEHPDSTWFKGFVIYWHPLEPRSP